MSEGEPGAAVAPLCQRDVDRFGDNLTRCYPVDGSSPFDDLLTSIDRIESALREDAAKQPL